MTDLKDRISIVRFSQSKHELSCPAGNLVTVYQAAVRRLFMVWNWIICLWFFVKTSCYFCNLAVTCWVLSLQRCIFCCFVWIMSCCFNLNVQILCCDTFNHLIHWVMWRAFTATKVDSPPWLQHKLLWRMFTTPTVTFQSYRQMMTYRFLEINYVNEFGFLGILCRTV